MVQNAVLFVNHHKENSKAVSEEICSELKNRGVQVTVSSTDDCRAFSPSNKYTIAFSLGGDGTVLYVARLLAAFGTPILPVHLGTLGFLAGVDRNQWLDAYERWLCNTARISLRCMLEFYIKRNGKSVYSNTCLNDVVITSLGIAKLIRLKVETEAAAGEFANLGYYRSDGLIIATPTGSTAYSMAAGGPILDPEMEAQIISPICSFTLSNRPLVLPSRHTLHITVEKEQRSGVLLTVDGQDSFKLEGGDKIIIRHSHHYARLITTGRPAYYTALQRKLSWGAGSGEDAGSERGAGA